MCLKNRRQPFIDDFNYVRNVNLIGNVVNDSFTHFYEDEQLENV